MADLAINDPLDDHVGTKQYSPYFFYLIEHPKGAFCSIPGFTPKSGPTSQVGLGGSGGFSHRYGSRMGDVVAQLAKLGLRQTDIDFVVQSHLHFDHAGGLEFCPPCPGYLCRGPSWRQHVSHQPIRLNFTPPQTSNLGLDGVFWMVTTTCSETVPCKSSRHWPQPCHQSLVVGFPSGGLGASWRCGLQP